MRMQPNCHTLAGYDGINRLIKRGLYKFAACFWFTVRSLDDKALAA